jgi:hypothetical protein
VRPTELDGVTISSKGQPRLDVALDISFPHCSCHLLHLDVMDGVSQHLLPLDELDSQFIRLDASGNELGRLPPDLLESTPTENCETCYNLLKSAGSECCRSCQDVFRVYRERGYRPPPLRNVQQCASVDARLGAFAGEGCRVRSKFRAIRMGGEFHIAPGLSWFNEGWHVHDIEVFSTKYEEINLTHTVNGLKFAHGDGATSLDGHIFVQEEHRPWRAIYTADVLGENYSVSRYGLYTTGTMSPGIYFKYDVSPITAVEYLDKEPLLHLVTRLLTVIGAVLGIFRIADAVSYRTRKAKAPQKIDG